MRQRLNLETSSPMFSSSTGSPSWFQHDAMYYTHTHTHTHVRQVRINHPVNLLAGFGGQWTGGRRSCDPTEARERPKLVD